MTHFNDITLRNPIALQAAGNWNYSGQMHHGSITDPIYGASSSRRGTFHLGLNSHYNTVLTRLNLSVFNSQLAVSADHTRTNFSTAAFSPATSTRTCGFIYSMHHFDGYMWILGEQTTTFRPFVAALIDGVAIPTTASVAWVDRSGDTPFGASAATPNFMCKASDGKLYYLMCNQVNAITTMTAASTVAAVTTGFTTAGTWAAGAAFGYGISVDGSIQMLSTGVGTARSTNSGAGWGDTMNFGVTVSGRCEFVHVPKFGNGRWCATVLTGAGRGLWWTDDNGSSWTRSTLVGGGSTTNFHFTMIEKLNPTGEVLLGFYGIAPCQVYISLNGGKQWAFLTSVVPPYFDVVSHPEIANEAEMGCIVVNDGSRISLHWPGATGDEGVFVSDMFGLPGYTRDANDPRNWSP